MGKSAASLAIASKLNCPIVDVTRLPVGSHTLTGLLTDVLGWTQFPEYIQAIQKGEACLVLDGLDEAQLKSGREHFIAFIDDVARILKDANGVGGQVIMFGRTDAIEIAYLQLIDQGIPTDLATIQPLTYSQSCELLDATLDALETEDGSPFTVHRKFRASFESMRDKILGDIATSLGVTSSSLEASWGQVAEFLGYPPVLLVLAETMAVPNPSSNAQVLNLSEQRSTRGELLRRIVEGILEREAEKVRNLLRSVLKLEPSDPRLNKIFTKEEQVLRLVAYLSRSTGEMLLPIPLEPHEKQIYEDHLKTFLPDHPFLKNRKTAGVVFSDYVRAYSSTTDLSSLHGVGPQAILEACPALGPFYVHFVHGLTPMAPNSNRFRVIPESIIDDLVKSTLAGSSGDELFVLHMGKNALFLNLIHDVNSDWDGETLNFLVLSPSGIVELSSPLSHGFVSIPEGGLVLHSSSSGEFHLGPSVQIFVDELEILANTLLVDGHGVSDEMEEDETSVIYSGSTVRHNAQFEIRAHSPQLLACDVPNITHHWRPFLRTKPIPTIGIPEQKATQLLYGIRRVLRTFGKSSAGDPSVYGEMLDKRVVGRNDTYAVARDALVEVGLVKKDDTRYTLNTSRLDQYGISYASLRTDDAAATLANVYADVCKLDRVIAWAQA